MNFLKRIFTKKEKNKETVLDFLCCVLSCWLISVGASLIVDARYSIQIGIKSILWQTLFAIVVAIFGDGAYEVIVMMSDFAFSTLTTTFESIDGL